MVMSSYQEQLLVLKDQYEQRLAKTQQHLFGKDEPVSANFHEQTVEMQNEDVVEQLGDEAKLELALVNKALQKIADGEYGACESCGKEINAARLEALPQAAQCINCAD
jgi:RNA polymerase-binding protein DksA